MSTQEDVGVFFLLFYSVNYKNIVLQWQYTSDFRKLRCENFQPCTAHPKSSSGDGFNTIDELLYEMSYCPVMYALNNLNMTVELKTLFTSFTFCPLDKESAKISSDALKTILF